MTIDVDVSLPAAASQMDDSEQFTRLNMREVAVTLMSSADGAKYTDLHFESNKPVMCRLASNQWVMPKDADDKPYILPHSALQAFMHALYGGAEADEKPDNPRWMSKLMASYSVHPSTYIGMPGPNGEAIMQRVRCAAQLQNQGESLGIVLRTLREVPESVESLGLPIQTRNFFNASAGLVIITGPTGSGKTTSIAAMLNEINKERSANIVTIEDPVEHVHERKKSIINQRELGVDVQSFQEGVRDALRFVPDVIVIGEIRDSETMKAALRAAESGHLVLTTLHAPTTLTALRKVQSYLDSQADSMSLSTALVGIIAQALVTDNKGNKHLAYEILDGRQQAVQEAISNTDPAIAAKKFMELDAKLRGNQLGNNSLPMQTSLERMVKKGGIDPRRIAAVAINPDDAKALFNMMVPGGAGRTGTTHMRL